jgi:hypothetical protein
VRTDLSVDAQDPVTAYRRFLAGTRLSATVD